MGSVFLIPWDRAVAQQSAAIAQVTTDSLLSGGKIALVEHEKVIRGDDVIVIGRFKNEGKEPARSFVIQVELFDSKEKLVDVFKESYYGTIQPGEIRSFRASSGSCRSRPFPEHAKYKISILEG